MFNISACHAGIQCKIRYIEVNDSFARAVFIFHKLKTVTVKTHVHCWYGVCNNCNA